MSAKNRQELLDEIAAYHPFNEQEERDKNLIFQWIEQPGPGWAAMQIVRRICYQWPFVR